MIAKILSDNLTYAQVNSENPNIEKMGFNIVGDEFDIPNLGPHKKGFINL